MSQRTLCTLFALGAVVASSCIVVVDVEGEWGGWDGNGALAHQMGSAEEIHISAEGIERLSCSTRDGTLSVVGKPEAEEILVVGRDHARDWLLPRLRTRDQDPGARAALPCAPSCFGVDVPGRA